MLKLIPIICEIQEFPFVFRGRRNLENSTSAHEDEIESLTKELRDSKLLIEESDKKYEEVWSGASSYNKMHRRC